MAVHAAFQPSYTKGQTLSANSSSQTATILATPKSVVVTNTGSNIGYVRIGTGSITASTADYPILPGSKECLSKAQGDDKLAYISASGTTLHVIPGEGF